MLRSLILSASLVAGFAFAQPSAAKDCRSAKAPPGVRVPEEAGCKPRPDAARGVEPQAKTGRAPGFFDLGNGAQLRIGGGVDAEIRSRR